MSSNITFFDIPSHHPDGRSCSPFTWLVRLALNYKKLPYTTTWLTPDQIESVCKAKGIPPSGVHFDGSTKYSCPSLIDATDANNIIRISDSRVIIEYLDKTYPDLPLNPTSEQAKATERYALTNLGRAVAPLVRRAYINGSPPNVFAYYEQFAPSRWGTSLQAAIEAGGEIGSDHRETLWAEVQQAFEGFGLKDKWLSGSEEPQYEDLVVLSWMMLIYVSGEDGWSKVETWENGRWKQYWEAAEEYLVTK
jgi:glutathione S-transferase